MKRTRISQILLWLMEKQKIRVSDLARSVQLPQPTVHRIVSGNCENPHLSSLSPIANFFSISVDQLKGLDPISGINQNLKVPLLTWEQALNWPNRRYLKSVKYVFTDANIGKNSYALILKDSSMAPAFTQNTILINDPDRKPSDRSYVIAKLSNLDHAVFRQLLVNAGKKYLKTLCPEFDKDKMLPLTSKDEVISVVIQAKKDYEI